MNKNQIRMFDLNNNIERQLDAASMYWRPAYYGMDTAMVAAERRDRAIASVIEAIKWFEAEDLTMEDIATLIVDQSDFALNGYNLPHGAWFRRLGRQIIGFMVPSNRV